MKVKTKVRWDWEIFLLLLMWRKSDIFHRFWQIFWRVGHIINVVWTILTYWSLNKHYSKWVSKGTTLWLQAIFQYEYTGCLGVTSPPSADQLQRWHRIKSKCPEKLVVKILIKEIMPVVSSKDQDVTVIWMLIVYFRWRLIRKYSDNPVLMKVVFWVLKNKKMCWYMVMIFVIKKIIWCKPKKYIKNYLL